ncbi:MAG TPA: Fur family transcriptional regulator [Solirubrobacterales bacterium]|nr:Fur family transcriptional regulator [Solirubrobacterales bacterium]
MKQDTVTPTEGEEWAAAARVALEREGHRSGGARDTVIELLAAAGGCLEAEDVAEQLRSQGQRVGTASVYRALALLSELGLLERVAVGSSAARYELVLADGGHHHHIVCDDCGETVPFSDGRLESAVHGLAAPAGFEIRAHEVTLHGSCPGCRG